MLSLLRVIAFLPGESAIKLLISSSYPETFLAGRITPTFMTTLGKQNKTLVGSESEFGDECACVAQHLAPSPHRKKVLCASCDGQVTSSGWNPPSGAGAAGISSSLSAALIRNKCA